MESRNLVLGAVRGYRFEALAPFVNSLRATSYRGEVVLFDFGGIDGATCEALAAAGVRLERPRDPVLLDASIFDVSMARYLAYLELLGADGAAYDRVLLTDVRDVVFQADPFLADTGPSLACFLEHDGTTIAQQVHNARWVHSCYGPTGLERIGRCPISCSGTTTGTAAAVKRYLERLCREAVGIRARQRLLPGSDQAIHNHLIWTRQLDDLHLFPNGLANVLTLGIMPQERIRFDAEGMLRNADGTLPAIVHQYDRLPILSALLTSRYGLAPSAPEARPTVPGPAAEPPGPTAPASRC